jgi:peptidyl-prolyl cis-trans isomerase SurA
VKFRSWRSEVGPWVVLTCAALLAPAALAPSEAQATVVEKVVAIVGERAIWLSDLRERARPFISRITAGAAPGAQRAAALSQLYGALLDEMVNEELLLRAANKANVGVTGQEISNAIEYKAKAGGITAEQLLKEVENAGWTGLQYREELRRQLLKEKMMSMRFAGRARVREEDLRAQYDDYVKEERKQLGFQAAWIRMDPSGGTSAAQVAELAKRAAVVAAEAKTADFGALARRHSTDSATQETGGLLPEMKPGQLPERVDAALQQLEVGQVSSAIRYGSSYVILKLVKRDESSLPAYDDAKAELEQRVQERKAMEANRTWLAGLRKRTHVDIRW